MSFLYNLLIHIYNLSIRIASLYHPKAKEWVKGRKGLFKKLESKIDHSSPIIWFHAASLGEFEQGRPVIEAYKKKYSDHKILLTFFSPSGYNIRKNYSEADYVFYLPIDKRKNASRFISIVNPERVIFIKYEYWYNYLSILKSRNIPVYIISANFRSDQYFFKWYGSWSRKMLRDITQIFVQNKQSEEILKANNIKNCTISGDTRFDRVYEVAKKKQSFPLIESFCKESNVLLAGSSWPEEESFIYQLLQEKVSGLKVIIAPHEVHQEHIQSIINHLNCKFVKYSELEETTADDADVLIIDTIGILLHLYQYATVAFIGGGFGKGIHNILEAATFGKPILFGPNYQKFEEAKALIKLGGAFAIEDFNIFNKLFNNLIKDSEYYKKVSEGCSNYVKENKGATELILNSLK